MGYKKKNTYSFVHVGNNLLDVGNLTTRLLVFLGRVARCELNFARGKLELGAGNGRLKSFHGLRAQFYVVLGLCAGRGRAGVGVAVLGWGQRGKLEGKGQFEVGLGDNRVVGLVYGLLVVEGLATVVDGEGKAW